eukprot:2288079-Pleurochrysis_carterae.AAC.3
MSESDRSQGDLKNLPSQQLMQLAMTTMQTDVFNATRCPLRSIRTQVTPSASTECFRRPPGRVATYLQNETAYCTYETQALEATTSRPSSAPTKEVRAAPNKMNASTGGQAHRSSCDTRQGVPCR